MQVLTRFIIIFGRDRAYFLGQPVVRCDMRGISVFWMGALKMREWKMKER